MKKNKVLITLVCLFLSIYKVNAQMIVMDPTAIATAISNGVTMSSQLENAYAQFQNQLQQLQALKKQMEALDITKFGNISDLTSLLGEMENAKKNVNNAIKEKNMKIGNVSFSLEDLYTTNVYSKISGTEDGVIDTAVMTEEDKARFYIENGISPEEYNKMVATTKELGNKAMEVRNLNEEAAKVVNQSRTFTETVLKNSNLSDSQVGNLQQQNLILGQTLSVMTQATDSLIQVADMIARDQARIVAEENKKIQEMNMYMDPGKVDSDFANNFSSDANCFGPTKKRNQ